MFNPILIGWVNYYGLFYKSEIYCVLKHINRALLRGPRVNIRNLKGTSSKLEIGSEKLPDVILNCLSTGKWGFFLGLDNGSRMNREVQVRL
jgi:hypothetical protein